LAAAAVPKIAAELSVPLWGQVPIDPGLSAAGEKALTADFLLTGIFDSIAQGLNGTFGD
jgi:ATP-binding protein involved in chromosome partitioning